MVRRESDPAMVIVWVFAAACGAFAVGVLAVVWGWL
jgi:hypothetical protein